MAEKDVSRRYDELAARQHGVVGVRQLYELGLSDDWVASRVSEGWLHRVHRGVYAVGNPRLSARGHWMAAVVACGPSALLSHRSAAALWGLVKPNIALPAEETHVSVTARGNRSRAGIALHRRELTDADRTEREGIPVTGVELTLLDLGTDVRGRPLERAIDEAVHRGLLTESAIELALDRFAGRRGAGALRTALDLRGGVSTRTRSELEERFLALCRSHHLPQPVFNAPLHGLTVDCLWAEARLVVELDGQRSHATRRAFQADRDRDSLLAVHGYVTLRFTWHDVTQRPAVVAHRLRQVLAGRSEARGVTDGFLGSGPSKTSLSG